MKFGCGNNFGQLLHVCGLDVENVCKTCIKIKIGQNASVSETKEQGATDAVVSLYSHALKLWSEMFRFHRLIRKSSADMYVSPSELSEMELI